MERSVIKLLVFFSVACCVWCGVIKVAGNDSKSYWDAKSREIDQGVKHDRINFIVLYVALSVVVGVPIVLGVVICFVRAGVYVVRICSGKEEGSHPFTPA